MIKNVAFKSQISFTTLPGPAALRAVKGALIQGGLCLNPLGFCPPMKPNLCLIGLLFLSLSRPPLTRFS